MNRMQKVQTKSGQINKTICSQTQATKAYLDIKFRLLR